MACRALLRAERSAPPRARKFLLCATARTVRRTVLRDCENSGHERGAQGDTKCCSLQESNLHGYTAFRPFPSNETGGPLLHRKRTFAREVAEQHPPSADPAERKPLINCLNVFHLVQNHCDLTGAQQCMCDAQA